ncbi:hypothetical protein [Tenacibaculum phage JQ]|nr:hypothetical protein [Tenacibaculum phage JQ]
MPNRFINKWGIALLRVVGIAGFTYKTFSEWDFEWWVEIAIMTFFIAVALSPKRIVEFIKGKTGNKPPLNNSAFTGGSTPIEDDEESEA